MFDLKRLLQNNKYLVITDMYIYYFITIHNKNDKKVYD